MALQFFNSRTFEANTFEAGLWTGAGVAPATSYDSEFEFTPVAVPMHFTPVAVTLHFTPEAN